MLPCGPFTVFYDATRVFEKQAAAGVTVTDGRRSSSAPPHLSAMRARPARSARRRRPTLEPHPLARTLSTQATACDQPFQNASRARALTAGAHPRVRRAQVPTRSPHPPRETLPAGRRVCHDDRDVRSRAGKARARHARCAPSRATRTRRTAAPLCAPMPCVSPPCAQATSAVASTTSSVLTAPHTAAPRVMLSLHGMGSSAIVAIAGSICDALASPCSTPRDLLGRASARASRAGRGRARCEARACCVRWCVLSLSVPLGVVPCIVPPAPVKRCPHTTRAAASCAAAAFANLVYDLAPLCNG